MRGLTRGLSSISYISASNAPSILEPYGLRYTLPACPARPWCLSLRVFLSLLSFCLISRFLLPFGITAETEHCPVYSPLKPY